jgi:hypothetical protein
VPVQARLAPVEQAQGLASPPPPAADDHALLNPIAMPQSIIVDNSQIPRHVNESQSAPNRFNVAMAELRDMSVEHATPWHGDRQVNDSMLTPPCRSRFVCSGASRMTP